MNTKDENLQEIVDEVLDTVEAEEKAKQDKIEVDIDVELEKAEQDIEEALLTDEAIDENTDMVLQILQHNVSSKK